MLPVSKNCGRMNKNGKCVENINEREIYGNRRYVSLFTDFLTNQMHNHLIKVVTGVRRMENLI